MKQCSNCPNQQEESNFRQRRYIDGKLYLSSICRKCESAKQVKRVQKSGLTNLQKSKMASYNKQYKKENRVKLRKQYRDRIQTDPVFRLRKIYLDKFVVFYQ